MKTDYRRRDEIIFNAVSEPGSYDIHRFENLRESQLRKLIDEGLADPGMTQNNSPTIKKIMEFLTAYPVFRGIGYVITPLREDCRVSIEGVEVMGNVSEDDRKAFKKMFKNADEFTNEPGYLRAWYD